MTHSTSAERPEMGLQSADPSLKSPSSTPPNFPEVVLFLCHPNLGPHHLFGLWQWPLMASHILLCHNPTSSWLSLSPLKI